MPAPELPVVEFVVPGTPRAWQRTGFNRHGGHFYTKKRTRSVETAVGWNANIAMAGRQPHDGPVGIWFRAYFAAPASWNQWLLTESQQTPIVHTVKPDADNIIKAIKDGCNGIVYTDDARVCIFDTKDGLPSGKFYGFPERTEVRFTFYTKIKTKADFESYVLAFQRARM